MIQLTKNEKNVLIVLILVIYFGSIAQFLNKRFPRLINIVNLIESDILYEKVDINQATAEELEAIPYIGEYTAKQIVFYRTINGPFKKIQDLIKVKGIRERNFKRFAVYLTVDDYE